MKKARALSWVIHVIGVGRKSIGKKRASPQDGECWNTILTNTRRSLSKPLSVPRIVKWDWHESTAPEASDDVILLTADIMCSCTRIMNAEMGGQRPKKSLVRWVIIWWKYRSAPFSITIFTSPWYLLELFFNPKIFFLAYQAIPCAAKPRRPTHQLS